MAENCSEAAARLRESENASDRTDAKALAAAAAIHRAEAERHQPPQYWWQEKD